MAPQGPVAHAAEPTLTCLADNILTTCERLRNSPLWAPLLYEAAISKSWHSDALVHDKMYACLVAAKMDLQGERQRIEAFIYPKVTTQCDVQSAQCFATS